VNDVDQVIPEAATRWRSGTAFRRLGTAMVTVAVIPETGDAGWTSVT